MLRERNEPRRQEFIKNLPKLKHYSGTADWRDFEAQFMRHKQNRGLSDDEANEMLAMYLEGKALHYFDQLPGSTRQCLSLAMKAMSNRFSQMESSLCTCAKFSNTNQREGEGFREYA